MPSRARQTISLAVLASLLLTGGCARSSDGPVLVFAAASLTDVLEEAAAAYTADRGLPDRAIRFHFHSSDICATQIRRGAPADLIVSADDEIVVAMAHEGLVARRGYRRLAGNRLALIVPRRPEAVVGSMDDLRGEGWGRFALGDPATVPAGRYGAEALIGLGLWDRVAPRVLRAEHVRQVLLYVARGEADAGIVYLTDAQAESAVAVAEVISETVHAPIIYSAAVLREARRADLARDFLAFLSGPAGREVWRRHGFGTLDSALRQQGLPGD